MAERNVITIQGDSVDVVEVGQRGQQGPTGSQGGTGVTGPTGPTGPTEEDLTYAGRFDDTGVSNPEIYYRGEAAVGSATSASAWRIRRITIASDGDVTTEWADGDANFDNVWDNRAALSYS